MKIKAVHMYEAIEFGQGRQLTAWFIDKEGDPNQVKMDFYPQWQILVMKSVRFGDVSLIPIHGNVKYMKPFEGEAIEPKPGRPKKDGSA
jgi:hypothetical protein